MAEGDDVTISALMHNMAWLRMLLMRQAVLTGLSSDGSARYALANAESTDRFDEIVGDSIWRDLKPILRAQIVSLQGDAAQAVVLYNEHLTSTTVPPGLQANLLADKAWGHTQLNQNSEARACAEMAVNKINDETQIDNVAAAHSRLAQAFYALDQKDNAKLHESLANESWKIHATIQLKTVDLLGNIDENGIGIKANSL